MAVVVLILLVGATGIASANNGPHGGYTAITDACAGCHRTHTAEGPHLVRDINTYNLCMSCHGSTATGAVTNVDDGVWEGVAGSNVGSPLNGGGFTNYMGEATTSSHDVSETITDAWGAGATPERGIAASMIGGEALGCASCHDPHGSPNYRIIKETINGVAVAVDQTDEGAWDYDSEDWAANMSNVCGACHTAYHETAANVGSDAGAWAYPGGFTHRVDMSYAYGSNANPETTGFGGYNLPLGDSGGLDSVVCNTCHLSHGSSAAMTGTADGGPGGGGTLPGDTTATDSALLRLDDRGVCEVCHQK
jgi:predicted CXXCH cytochrome family protein